MVAEGIHIQDDYSNDRGRRADIALAGTAVRPVVASSFRAGRGTSRLGAGSLAVAASLSDALSLGNV